MSKPEQLPSTITENKNQSINVPNVRVTITAPDGSDVEVALGLKPIVIGLSPECDLALSDPRVSRRHCELSLSERGILLRDLKSKNGTFIEAVQIAEAMLNVGAVATIGGSRLVARVAGSPSTLPFSPASRFGDAMGKSLVMRVLFHKLEQAAASTAPILLVGEPGTGRRTLAEAVHRASPRRDAPFMTFDCSTAVAGGMAEQLLGDVAGASRGAGAGHAGLLEQTSGGTVYLQEPHEIPLETQYMLLWALGSSHARQFDVRIIAATHKDPRTQVAAGSLRADLYQWLAGVEVIVPPLRERKGDIPLLVEHLLRELNPPGEALPPDTMALLEAHSWPGNVSELRKIVEDLAIGAHIGAHGGQRALASLLEQGPGSREALNLLCRKKLRDARTTIAELFDKHYLKTRLEEYGGNVTKTADEMGIERPSLHRLLRKYGLVR